MTWNSMSVYKTHSPCWRKVAVVVVIGFTAHWAVKYYKNRASRKRRENYKKDVVILHQFRRGKLVPNLSPFCLKLETYLRMANIPYENDFEEPFGELGKTPWITYNGEDVADSQLCIEYLNRKLNVDFNSNLNEEELAIDHMIKNLLDNTTCMGLVLCRWIYSSPSQLASLMDWTQLHFPFPFCFFFRMVRKKQIERVKHHGIGLHSKETAFRLVKQDFRQLSTFIGKKKFVFGEKLSECDIVLFSYMAQCVWAASGTELEQWVHGEFPNLKEHCIRIKELFWPDWDSCIHK